MRISSSLVVAMLVLCPGCWRSPADEVLDAFISVNDSLGRTRARSDHRREELPPIPFADLGCPEYRILADSMALATEEVERALSPLFDDLAGVPQGDREAGERSFAKAQQGETLFRAIDAAYVTASRISLDDSTRSSIQDRRMSSFPYFSAADWHSQDITNAPRSAVVAVLSKVRTEVQQLRDMCDNALLQACLARNRAAH